MTTTAIRDGDHYVVNGSKTFITNGINADLVITAVKTDPSQRHRGMSLLVLERGMEGFERGRNLEKIGMHAQDTAELFFDDVRVPVDNRLGEEGKGFFQLVAQPAPGAAVDRRHRRSPRPAPRSTGRSAYAKERQAFGQPIGSFQNSRFALAEMATEIEIGQSFIDRCVLALNAGELTADEAAMAKWWCTELQGRVVDLGVQLHGGYGYMTRVPDRPGLRRRPHHADLRRHDRDHEGDHRPLARRLSASMTHAAVAEASDRRRRRAGGVRRAVAGGGPVACGAGGSVASTCAGRTDGAPAARPGRGAVLGCRRVDRTRRSHLRRPAAPSCSLRSRSRRSTRTGPRCTPPTSCTPGSSDGYQATPDARVYAWSQVPGRDRRRGASGRCTTPPIDTALDDDSCAGRRWSA